MAIVGITDLAPYWFTPTQEESETPTRFKLKPLDGFETLEVSAEVGARRVAAAQKLAVKYGLVDWENFCDESGNNIKFSRENFRLLPVGAIAEIAVQVINGATLDKEQKKN